MDRILTELTIVTKTFTFLHHWNLISSTTDFKILFFKQIKQFTSWWNIPRGPVYDRLVKRTGHFEPRRKRPPNVLNFWTQVATDLSIILPSCVQEPGADPEFPSRGRQPQRWGAKILIRPFSSENYMQFKKKIDGNVGAWVPTAPIFLNPPMDVILPVVLVPQGVKTLVWRSVEVPVRS